MQGDDPNAYAIPDSKALIAEYLLLYSMSGPNGFVSIVDLGYRRAIVRTYQKRDDAQFGSALIHDLKEYSASRFAGLRVTGFSMAPSCSPLRAG